MDDVERRASALTELEDLGNTEFVVFFGPKGAVPGMISSCNASFMALAAAMAARSAKGQDPRG